VKRIIHRRPDGPVSERRGDTFFGTVYADPVLPATDGVTISAVFFTPAARTFWHRHERGQVLHALLGSGWVCAQGGQPQRIRRRRRRPGPGVRRGPGVRAAVSEVDGVEVGTDAAGTAAGAAVVILILPASGVVEQVLDGGLLSALAPGALLVDLSSSEPARTRAPAGRVHAAGARLVDAPVSGGITGARAGTLTIMVGGADADRRVRPLRPRRRRVHLGVDRPGGRAGERRGHHAAGRLRPPGTRPTRAPDVGIVVTGSIASDYLMTCRSGFLAGLQSGLSMRRSAEIGCTLASFVLESVGTQEYTFAADDFASRAAWTYGADSATDVRAFLAAVRRTDPEETA
jgi:hypothetical protein